MHFLDILEIFRLDMGQISFCVFLKFFFCLSFFSFLIFLLQWLNFYWACLSFKKFWESMIHRDGQFSPWSSHVYSQEILLWVFCSNFWAFSCIFQAPLSRSLWSGYHWIDLFPLQKLSIDDANFGQCQKWNKGWGSSPLVTGGTEDNGLTIMIIQCIVWSLCATDYILDTLCHNCNTSY